MKWPWSRTEKPTVEQHQPRHRAGYRREPQEAAFEVVEGEHAAEQDNSGVSIFSQD